MINRQDIVGLTNLSLPSTFTIKVFDWSEKGHHKLLGAHTFTFKDLSFKTLTVPLIEGQTGYSITSPLEGESNGGLSILSVEPLQAPVIPQWQQGGIIAPPALRLKFSGVGLDALDMLGKSGT